MEQPPPQPSTEFPNKTSKLGHPPRIAGTRDANRSIVAGNREHHGPRPGGAGAGAQANVQAAPNNVRPTPVLMPALANEFLAAMPEANRMNSEYGSPGFLWPSHG